MATKKLDLNKIRDEIDKEKQSRMAPSHLGESAGGGVSKRDEFLNGLLVARQSGRDTPASTLIKSVDNKVAIKNGETTRHAISESAPTQRPINYSRINQMSPERDEQLYRDLEAKKNKNQNQTLGESIENFNGGQPQQQMNNGQVNYNGNQYLTTPPQQYQQQQPQQLNEGALVENVNNVVGNYLSNNLGAILDEAMKSTIIEMFAVERIKTVLNENRDLIKSVVVETIREIQERNKKKRV